MSLRVLVAGAAGVIGRRLVPMLLDRGYEVHGTTRSPARARELELQGAHAVVVDVLDGRAVVEAVTAARPRVVVHQLTDLSGGFSPERRSQTLARNSHLRVEGTRNLVEASRAVGARRLVAQSIAWLYAPGREPHVEDDPLDLEAVGDRAVTTRGVLSLEAAVLDAAPLEGVVLRYGWFYGPGANAKAAGVPPLHVDAAAHAAVLAIERGAPGIYNIAEPTPFVDVAKAGRELGWNAAFRCGGATPTR